jgi:hypothetical protein
MRREKRNAARLSRSEPLLIHLGPDWVNISSLYWRPSPPGGHKTLYDLELLSLVCRAAGFEHIEQWRFGESLIQPSPDSEHRGWRAPTSKQDITSTLRRRSATIPSAFLARAG